MKYKKIRIVGSSGSGKTYLGELIAKRTGYTFYPLDKVVYDFSKSHKFINKRTIKERNKIYEEIIKSKTWIMDGSYKSWSKESYECADLIIYLEKPLFFRTINVFKRFFQRIFEGKYEGISNFFFLLKYNFGEGRIKSKTRLEEIITEYGTKVKSFFSADNALEWFNKSF